MRSLLLVFILFVGNTCFAQSLDSKDESAIKSILNRQQKCWNNGDLECFMNGYWKSDSLKFIGSKGLTYGWQQTLDNYKSSYPDKSAMGELNFNVLSLESLGENNALLIGKWHLKRTKGDVGGHFSLTWKKINDEWVIIADHSS